MADLNANLDRICVFGREPGGRVHRAARWLAAPLAFGMLAACGAGEPGPTVSVRDSAGIRIAHNDLSTERAPAVCAVGPAALVRIGARDAGPEHDLYDVEDALRLVDGRIAVLNRGTREVRIFDATGGFDLSIGRDGEGPGEFRDPIELAVRPPDSLVVWDWELGRLSIFASDGTFVRAVRLRPGVANPTGAFGVLSVDSPFVIAAHVVRIPEGPGFAPQQLQLLRYDGDGALTDTIAMLPYGSRGWVDREARMIGSPLFEARATFAVQGERMYLAQGEIAEVEVRDANRRLRGLIRWHPPDRTVPAAEIEAYRRQRLSEATGGLRRLLERRFEAVPVAERFPAVRRLEVDRLGRVWVQRYPRPSSETQTWWAFDREGAFACESTIPKALTVLEFGEDYLLAKATDELGIEYVDLYDLARVGDAATPDGT